jgi:hypothetical protein
MGDNELDFKVFGTAWETMVISAGKNLQIQFQK